MRGAFCATIHALVLAGLATTSTRTSGLAKSFSALPWGPKMGVLGHEILPLHPRPTGEAPDQHGDVDVLATTPPPNTPTSITRVSAASRPGRCCGMMPIWT